MAQNFLEGNEDPDFEVDVSTVDHDYATDSDPEQESQQSSAQENADSERREVEEVPIRGAPAYFKS